MRFDGKSIYGEVKNYEGGKVKSGGEFFEIFKGIVRIKIKTSRT